MVTAAGIAFPARGDCSVRGAVSVALATPTRTRNGTSAEPLGTLAGSATRPMIAGRTVTAPDVDGAYPGAPTAAVAVPVAFSTPWIQSVALDRPAATGMRRRRR